MSSLSWCPSLGLHSGKGDRKVFSALALLYALAMPGCSSKTGGPAEEIISGLTPYTLVYPVGLDSDSAFIPEDNPLTVEKLELGRQLFFDSILSLDGTVSCASCHIPEKGFSDSRRFSKGVRARVGRRNSPTLVNRIFSAAQFWDGRADSLEDQAIQPVLNPDEMAMSAMETVADRLEANPGYVQYFRAAFPPEGAINPENIAKAIACFERTILSGNSPYDRYAAGDSNAMTDAAKRGLEIFNDENRGNCATCHVAFNFTDENYNNLGVGMQSDDPDMGRYLISGLAGHQGAFKTPTLREVANTAPYMHDGSQATLREVVEFYNQGGHGNRWLSPKMKSLNLTTDEQEDLVSFLEALSGEVTWYKKSAPR